MRLFLTAALGSVLLLSNGCSTDTSQCESNPEVARVAAPVQLERLEQPFFQIRTPAEARQFVRQHPLFADQFLQRKQYPSEEVLDQALVKLATNQGLQKLGKEAEAEFKDTEVLKAQLQRMFQHVRYYFPDFRVPPVKTFVSGLSQDMFVNDSLMVLSLDFFVGPKASYRPNLPEYILRRYAPAYLMPTAALAVSSKYNQHALTNQTMLGEMVQFGKSLYFAEKVLPCTADTLLMGFTGPEMAGVQFNEGKIWAHFIEKNLIYNTAPFTIQKYMGERPNVPEIGQTCPGRVGAWVGWQIVRKYMAEHPNVTLKQLMAERDPQRILSESRYRPKR
ncbi:gliding motility-associated lipoprotein GldB [Hymenobacter daecheongensis DSM 21074]|uniref:Gliding motility-associated lipoprotein GldB n=1 Tax=Hymenobacter daecheongensis DSM 21074 TaxID=1121955 RepID=A0A1M6A0Z9_9BACT|nr:gliding motility lipoprotein GldB [Hymenobacter daecheongensis]SHI30194.1 gliding motility-associated lipoprotein GldB [Hymenobacter daecheongensis DSM 21074]